MESMPKSKRYLRNSILHLNMQRLFQYIFVICIVLNFRSIWLYADGYENVGMVVKVIMGLSVIFCIFMKGRISASNLNKCLISISILSLYIIVWNIGAISSDSSVFNALFELIAILVYASLVEDSMDDTIHIFINITLVIAAVSLIFWLFGSVLGILKPTGIFFSRWAADLKVRKIITYYNIYYENGVVKDFSIFSGGIPRNCAIFTEAPMCSMVFSIAFLAEYLLAENRNIKKCAILAAAIISTVSTTGITALLLAFVLKQFFRKSRTLHGQTNKAILIPILVLGGVLLIRYFILQKLMTNSGLTRLDDFVAGFKAWMNAPIFGNGYSNGKSITRFMSSFRMGNTGFANSVMQILALGGIWLFAAYVYPVKGIIKLVLERDWNRVLFYLIYLYMFSITISTFQMLTYYIFISMAREGKKEIIQNSSYSSKKCTAEKAYYL